MSASDRESVGIVGVGVYLPYYRLDHQVIALALETGGGSGSRCVASYDEDSTTMAVEAMRSALSRTPKFDAAQLILSTTRPAYEDKSNAVVVHAALGLDPAVFAADCCGSMRSGVGALRLALTSDRRSSVVLSDVRTGMPGSDDERLGGDAASALLVGHSSDEVIATLVSDATVTEEFLERWRVPGGQGAQTWEERFGEHVYVPLGVEAFETALKAASLSAGDIDHVAIVGLNERAVRALAGRLPVNSAAHVNVYRDQIGNSATASVGIALASALRRARPGDHIMLLSLSDGADAFIFRATASIVDASLPDVGALVAESSSRLSYGRFATWRGNLMREPPRRPEPIPPAAPPSLRSAKWKFAFIGTECIACGTIHVPAQRVCIGCGLTDEMKPRPLAGVPATLATYTVDHLAASLNPPAVAVIADFDGGGRYRCDLTDCEPSEVAVGNRVEMTFRRAFTAHGIHNYVWKARPQRKEAR
jgi:hydroxymethylglutaryl-CoA synthase